MGRVKTKISDPPWCASSAPFQVGAASISWAAGGASRPPASERTRARGLNFGAWTPIRPALRASAGVFGPRLLLGSQEGAKTHQRPSFLPPTLEVEPPPEPRLLCLWHLPTILRRCRWYARSPKSGVDAETLGDVEMKTYTILYLLPFNHLPFHHAETFCCSMSKI